MSGIANALAGGVIVVIGVVLAEWLQRGRSRRDQVRAATLELIVLVPHVVAGMAPTGTGTDTSPESPWWQRRERVFALLSLVETSTNRRGHRNRKIRSAADDLSARLAAAELDFFQKGVRIPVTAVLDISAANLRSQVLGNRDPLDEKIQSYRQE